LSVIKASTWNHVSAHVTGLWNHASAYVAGIQIHAAGIWNHTSTHVSTAWNHIFGPATTFQHATTSTATIKSPNCFQNLQYTPNIERLSGFLKKALLAAYNVLPMWLQTLARDLLYGLLAVLAIACIYVVVDGLLTLAVQGCEQLLHQQEQSPTFAAKQSPEPVPDLPAVQKDAEKVVPPPIEPLSSAELAEQPGRSEEEDQEELEPSQELLQERVLEDKVRSLERSNDAFDERARLLEDVLRAMDTEE
jgi:hypothetical protein